MSLMTLKVSHIEICSAIVVRTKSNSKRTTMCIISQTITCFMIHCVLLYPHSIVEATVTLTS